MEMESAVISSSRMKYGGSLPVENVLAFSSKDFSVDQLVGLSRSQF